MWDWGSINYHPYLNKRPRQAECSLGDFKVVLQNSPPHLNVHYVSVKPNTLWMTEGISDSNLRCIGGISNNSDQILSPNQIIVTKPKSISIVLFSKSSQLTKGSPKKSYLKILILLTWVLKYISKYLTCFNIELWYYIKASIKASKK